mmetsp:Transcript_106153/g.317096  ORF Transcript_106153/g.317096 Transcript_106153/m.317096 type:complete len:266 (-) Transcript_106153:308-1105(-)
MRVDLRGRERLLHLHGQRVELAQLPLRDVHRTDDAVGSHLPPAQAVELNPHVVVGHDEGVRNGLLPVHQPRWATLTWSANRSSLHVCVLGVQHGDGRFYVLQRVVVPVHHAQQHRVVEVRAGRVLGVFVPLLYLQGPFGVLQGRVQLPAVPEVAAQVVEGRCPQRYPPLEVRHVVRFGRRLRLGEQLQGAGVLACAQALHPPYVAADDVALHRHEEVLMSVTKQLSAKIDGLLQTLRRGDEPLLGLVRRHTRLEAFNRQDGLVLT